MLEYYEAVNGVNEVYKSFRFYFGASVERILVRVSQKIWIGDFATKALRHEGSQRILYANFVFCKSPI
jgi:hypothetical protein